jgi:glucose/arabinose dehydrogenase
MIPTPSTLLVIASFFLPALAQSSSCSTTLTPTNSVRPSVASGYRAQLIATGLSSPRSIEFDKAGNLLVVEQKNAGGSVSVLTLQDNGGTCLGVTSHTTLVTQSVRNLTLSTFTPPISAIQFKQCLFIPPSAKSNSLL